MRDELQEIITLQRQFSANNTPAMQRRGDLIRRALPGQLAVASVRIARALSRYGQDLNFEGRDGTGLKTYVPWVRFFSRAESHSAQEGWYCVYLFEAGGRGVYLALAHGSTTIEDGAFKPKPAEQLAEYVAWGKSTLRDAIAADRKLVDPIMLGGKQLSDSYERSTVVAKWYADGQLPDDEQLYADVEQFAVMLQTIYEGDRLGRAPQGLPPEIVAVERAAAGPQKQAASQGFGLTAPERSAIERHAMAVAKQHLRQLKWYVQDVSADRSYDFLCRHKGEELIVEVKGTTSAGDQILVTCNEVVAHRKHYPHNALIVVHSIDLVRATAGPSAHGGELVMLSPWCIEDDHLSPIAYQCRVPIHEKRDA